MKSMFSYQHTLQSSHTKAYLYFVVTVLGEITGLQNERMPWSIINESTLRLNFSTCTISFTFVYIIPYHFYHSQGNFKKGESILHTTSTTYEAQNSRYCCKETPSTAGRNQDYFYPHFIQKLISKKLCHAI